MIRVFVSDDRLNVVDHNNVLVGFEYNTKCCEIFGHYTEDMEGSLCFTAEREGGHSYNIPGIFDPSFCEINHNEDTGYEDSLYTVSFRIVEEDTMKPLYTLVLFNEHNGYYGHGWQFSIQGLLKDKGVI